MGGGLVVLDQETHCKVELHLPPAPYETSQCTGSEGTSEDGHVFQEHPFPRDFVPCLTEMLLNVLPRDLPRRLLK